METTMNYTYNEIAGMIDHSLLRPTITAAEMAQGIDLALEYQTASVCIMPCYLKMCAQRLAGSPVQPSTVIGFPHGNHTTAIKLAEAQQAMDDGGRELDMVINISKALSGDWPFVRDDIKAVVDAAHARDCKVKVIFENCCLTDDQKIKLCQICGDLNADWVKTSTGFGAGGATIEDLTLMRKHAPKHVQVKAAGGIRDLDKLLQVRATGVTRVGATATAAILDEAKRRLAIT